MEFLKKNYEKILLGLILAGLIGVLVFMLFHISAEKQDMENLANGVLNPRIQALPDLDLTTNQAAVTRVKSPYVLDFETGNRLFNPLEWQKTAEGNLIPATQVTPKAVVVTAITPLYLVLTLDAVMTNELGARYVIGVERQAAELLSKRRKQQRYVSQGEKPNDSFSLVEVKGAPENPDAVVVKLADTGELASISHDKPFRRVDGYTVDFRYDLEKKVFRARRVKDRVSFGGVDYLIVEISQNELILSDQSNQKKTSLPFTP